jgi:RIO kinase 2
VIRLLTDEEWRVLRALEQCIIKKGSSNIYTITKTADQPIDRVEFALTKLNERGIIKKKGSNYAMFTSGFDLLSLKHHVDHNDVSALGKIIAKGKESDVYEVLSEKGECFALKLFRLGRTSFRDVKRKRFSDRAELHNWITRNYQAAKREFESLGRLEGLTDSIPRAIASNRHTVLLEELRGIKLAERPELINPASTLREVIMTVKKAYANLGLINGDLSEYNILTDGKRAWLIDWPQCVGVNHPNASELLNRDISSILKFFRRVYGIYVERKDALSYVNGISRKLVIRRE